MPRVAEADALEPSFPWGDWEAQLKKSPTGALFFDRSDFGAMPPYAFQRRAKKALGFLDVTVRVRGDEVLVSLNA